MTKPTTILHTRVVTGAGGGPDKTILRSAAGLDHERYHAVAAYLHPAGDTGIDTLRGTAARFGMDMHSIPERGPFDLRAVRLMLDLCRRLSVDIWHAHDYKSDILGRLIRRRHPMKLVTTMHGFTGETWRTRLYARLSNPALRGYDRVIAVSPLLMRYAAEHGVHPDRLRYVPNAIDLREYRRQRDAAQAKAELGIAPDERAIAVVGRFSIEKGVDRAIRLFASMRRVAPDIRLHLIGDGPERRNLESLAESLGVADAIRWWGWQRDTRTQLEAMDLLLLTSHTEGLPNAVLEAMALGVPVAATKVGAVPDVLDHGRCGVLLNEDSDDWLEQVQPLLMPSPRRAQMIDSAYARLSQRYEFAARMRRIADIYREVAGLTTDNPAPQQLAPAQGRLAA